MKPLKPEEFAGVGGAAPPTVSQLPDCTLDPLPLPAPVAPDIEINQPR